jgi:hypothetical protein
VVLEERQQERLCEDVGSVEGAGYPENCEGTIRYMFSYEVIPNVDVLSAGEPGPAMHTAKALPVLTS